MLLWMPRAAATAKAVAEKCPEKNGWRQKEGDQQLMRAWERCGRRGWATRQHAGDKAGDEAGDETSEAGNDSGDEAVLASMKKP